MTFYKDTHDVLPIGKSRAMVHPKDRKPREKDEQTYAWYELLKKGERIPLFEKFLYKKEVLITSREIQICSRVKKLLYKDFITADKDFIKYVPMSVKGYFHWCWKKGYIKPPVSECHPEWRWFNRDKSSSLVLFYDGRLARPKNALYREVKDFHINEDGYQTYNTYYSSKLSRLRESTIITVWYYCVITLCNFLWIIPCARQSVNWWTCC